MFLTRTSCPKTAHANGYYGTWPGWAVSISVLPLTKSQSKERFRWPCFPGGPDSKASACNVESLGQEDPLEKEMATHSGILAWEISWTEEPGKRPWGHKRVGHNLFCPTTITTATTSPKGY